MADIAAVTATPPAADPQDPLPESTWFWRRIFVWAVTAFACWQTHLAADRLADIAVMAPTVGVPAFVSIIKWLLALVILMVTYYLVAPSAEQITKMIQMARLLKDPGFQVTKTATASGPEGTATTTTTAGKADAPAVVTVIPENAPWA